MDGGDLVTLIVSLATIAVSVFGAHELVRHQDKRKEVKELFSKIMSDARTLRITLDDFRCAMGDIITTDIIETAETKTGIVIERRIDKNQVHKLDHASSTAIANFAQAFVICKENNFLLNLIIGEHSAEPISQEITNYINCCNAIYHDWLGVTNEEELDERDKNTLSENDRMDGFKEEMEKAMGKYYKDLTSTTWPS